MRVASMVLVGALALAALPASALTITQTTSVSGALPFATIPITLVRFNSPGQVLQSVTLSFTTTGSGSATITAGNTAIFGVATTGLVSNAQTTTLGGNGFALSARGAGPVQTVLLGRNVVRTYTGFTPTASASETLTGDLSAFIGGGNLSFDFGVVDSSLDLAVGEANTTRSQAFNTDISFIYNSVAAVPEPATWGMMIMGFGLSGAALRRRRIAAA